MNRHYPRTIFLAMALCLALPLCASAHNADQLPFVVVNGKDLAVYQVGSTSLSNLVLPQDEPPEPYLIGQEVRFQLKTVNLPFPAELVPKLVFGWDFGDGTTSAQSDTAHVYARQGSYAVTLNSANPGEGVPPQILDIIHIDILPRAGYTLPTSVIKVDGRKSSNAYTDILTSDFSKELQFDASSSSGGGSVIKSYLWDFGDQKKAEGVGVSHLYGRDWSYVSALLRVTTADGFVVDSMVQIENPNPVFSSTPKTSPAAVPSTGGRPVLLVVVAAVAVLLTLGFIFYRKRPL